ncbi:MAG TPA: amidase family protein, partial [Candidatus Angelobacter sp.]|nr:amidase family protein [Candidatus Angelobacter sp.]
MDTSLLTIESTRSAIAEKRLTAASLVEEFYKKIKAEDVGIHAYLTLCEDRALQQARHIDDLAARGGPLPPLAGSPVAIKDVMVTTGVRTTA